MGTDRRNFIRKIALGAGIATIHPAITPFPGPMQPDGNKKTVRISGIRKPLAIAMWDFSWILRHHRYGEFEDWDHVLEALAERGYNAIRMDAMPQFVASDSKGNIEQEFRSVKDGWRPSLWGNDYTMSFRPREALLEFLPKCRKYEIKVGLATWFLQHGTARKGIFREEGGLLRAWDETLSFLQSHGLLDNVIYVDLLNEYPNWHGYDWFKEKMNSLSDIKQYKMDNPDANLPDVIISGKGNPLQQEFYNDFISNLIRKMKEKYPGIDFFASLDSGMELDQIDLSLFNALDYHIWFEHSNKIPGLSEIRKIDQTLDYRNVYSGLLEFWKENMAMLAGWMDGRLSSISGMASKLNIVCGNTEGWGPIFWFDHPDLDWKWVKESAEICVDLARKHDNYKFICTSNFTHPHFRGMWEDIKWHRKVTDRIRG